MPIYNEVLDFSSVDLGSFRAFHIIHIVKVCIKIGITLINNATGNDIPIPIILGIYNKVSAILKTTQNSLCVPYFIDIYYLLEK